MSPEGGVGALAPRVHAVTGRAHLVYFADTQLSWTS